MCVCVCVSYIHSIPMFALLPKVEGMIYFPHQLR